MKFSQAVIYLASVALVNAQYFSAGWKPGNPVHDVSDAPAPTQTYVPEKPNDSKTVPNSPAGFSSGFDIGKILTSTPVASLFTRFGINITERVEAVILKSLWDERVPLLTDENFDDIVVNEPLTDEELADRVWVIAVSTTTAKEDGISKILDDVIDEAYNLTDISGEAPNVRWARMDYLNVTYITTKWCLWQAPTLVILKDRGKTLRFYRPQQLKLKAPALIQYVKTEGFKSYPAWSSAYAPGGSREYIVEFVAVWMKFIHGYLVMVPRWMFFVGSGLLGTVLINVLHREPPKKVQPRAAPQTKPNVLQSQEPVPSGAAATKRNGAKQRKPTKK